MKLPSLNLQILLAAIIGVLVGMYFHTLGTEHQLVKVGLYTAGLAGTLFIDLLKMILIPLVFCSISYSRLPPLQNYIKINFRSLF